MEEEGAGEVGAGEEGEAPPAEEDALAAFQAARFARRAFRLSSSESSGGAGVEVDVGGGGGGEEEEEKEDLLRSVGFEGRKEVEEEEEAETDPVAVGRRPDGEEV